MAGTGLQQVQRQAQTLVLAPQLRQSLKILQSAALDLRTAILEELQTNPVLEELPIEGLSMEAASSATGDETSYEPAEPLTLGGEGDFSTLGRAGEDYREYFAQDYAATQPYTSEDAERRQHFFDSLTTETSLQEHLMRQAELTDAAPATLQALEYLVGSLDDRGFLSAGLSDLALGAGLPLKDVQEAHKLLKSLEPAGIGALDLADCLLIQLRALGKERTLAAKMVRHHFDLLLRRRIPELARKLDVETEEVEEALEDITALDPAPGRRFRDDSNRVIVPDVKVEKQGEEWVVILNSDYIPRLRVSHQYKELIAKSAVRGKDREYLQEKIRSGKFLIGAIEQRQQTIERITRELLHFQREFFEEGLGKLKPLTMAVIAEAVGVHETTVSRAIANKYIETPHGVFELKYLFNPGYQSGSGEAVSNKSVKQIIQRIVEHEDPAKPFSDQDIVQQLREQGINIARRTIAKYREELGILPTSLRRRYR